MKKRIVIIIVLIILFILLWVVFFRMGYLLRRRVSLVETEKEQDILNLIEEGKSNEEKIKTDGAVIYNKSFGSYEVLNGWVESKEHSSDTKFFYVLNGEEKKARPNNISINSGKNKYLQSEHELFRQAILKQISMQVSNQEGVTINANGSTTDNGDIVYTFVIREEKENITTTQYYIVGDYKYILVHETVYEENGEVDKVAKRIVNSFKWKE